MESIDPLDRSLDPPDDPDFMECDGCGLIYPAGHLHKAGNPPNSPAELLCDDCLQEDADSRAES